MLKNRIFLMGFGAGIILGALLFQLMLLGEQSNQNLKQINNDTSEKLFTQAEVDALLKAERDSAKIDEQTKKEAEVEIEPPATTKQPAESSKEAAENDDQFAAIEEKAMTKPAVRHVIHIEAGSSLTVTADLLAKHNVIQSNTAFVNQMKKSKKLVRAGYFLFHEGISVDEAITIVTGQPLTKQQADSLTDETSTD
ncbi:hypothetical protein L1N85_01140 [Paenibacillus alkaliterrae]|uniref:hypothetical protein n=1 Tax=Paenibacillus alkaliterrae TaxID=320909 RepID=UPI001F341D26|nr:hypothetical protein [Paenibacillus alkaliterrae]MCF2937035.1 hypothetical protein [Paenibacillus alkaliterrae]